MALTAAKQHPIPKQESKGHPQIDFLVVVMASSSQDNNGDGDGVVQDDGHAPANRLTETYSLGL